MAKVRFLCKVCEMESVGIEWKPYPDLRCPCCDNPIKINKPKSKNKIETKIRRLENDKRDTI